MKKGWLRHLDFIIVDFIAIEISLLIAFCLAAFGFSTESFAYAQLFLVLPLLHIFVSIMTDTYNGILQRDFIKEFFALIKLDAIDFAILLLFFYFLELLPGLPQMIIIIYFIINLPLTCLSRSLHKFVLCKYYASIKNTRQIVIATTQSAAPGMLHALTESAIRNYQFLGLAILDQSMIGQKIGEVTVSADKQNFIDYVKEAVVDEVFINIPESSAYTLELAEKMLDMGITVHIYTEDLYASLPNRSVGNVFGYNVLTSSMSPISFRQSMLKRLFDITGGLIGCIFTLIIGLIIGPIIFIKSPGPIIFSQIRVGKRGREFKIYKFRSMYLDAEKRKAELMAQNKIQGNLMFKIDDDPRIIKGIGSFIRKTSLDEFPQFWNVLKGDMSLVGTRPPTIDEYRHYSPHHKRRLNMRPGITGLWQISGRSQIIDFEEVVKLDTEYIENWSLESDIKIILKTITRVIHNNDAF